MEDEDVISWPTDIDKLQQFRKEWMAQNAEYYSFNVVNEELWNKSVSRSAPISVTGCDGYEELENKVVQFVNTPPKDTRLKLNTYYVALGRHYYKEIRIPAGAQLVTPDPTTMNNLYGFWSTNPLSPMGFYPNDNVPDATKQYWGYWYKQVGTENGYDVYRLYTEVWVITHDISGRQIATESNPAYLSEYMYYPNEYIFQYTYNDVDWGR